MKRLLLSLILLVVLASSASSVSGLQEVWTFTDTDFWSMTVDDNFEYVYSGGVDNVLRKINATDATEIWNFTGHTSLVNTIETDDNGNIYSGSWDDTIRKIASNGTQLWKYTGHSNRVYGIVIGNNNEYVYSVASDDTVRKLNASDGSEIWVNTDSPGDTIDIDIDNAGNLYVAGSNIFMKIDSNGNQIWNYTEEDGRAVYSDSSVFLGTDNGNLIKLDSSDGSVLWDKSIFDSLFIHSMDADPDGYIYMGGSNGLAAKASSDGNIVWKTSLHSRRVTDIVIDNNGNIYTSSLDETIKKTLDECGDNNLSTKCLCVPNLNDWENITTEITTEYCVVNDTLILNNGTIDVGIDKRIDLIDGSKLYGDSTHLVSESYYGSPSKKFNISGNSTIENLSIDCYGDRSGRIDNNEDTYFSMKNVNITGCSVNIYGMQDVNFENVVDSGRLYIDDVYNLTVSSSIFNMDDEITIRGDSNVYFTDNIINRTSGSTIIELYETYSSNIYTEFSNNTINGNVIAEEDYSNIYNFYDNTFYNSVIGLYSDNVEFIGNTLDDNSYYYMRYSNSVSDYADNMKLNYKDNNGRIRGDTSFIGDTINFTYDKYVELLYDEMTFEEDFLVNVSDVMQFSNDWVYVDNESGFNQPATITFKNITDPTQYYPTKDGIFCQGTGDCENITYGTDSIEFDVSGFSNYSYENNTPTQHSNSCRSRE